jgi:RHS repeat-associated protein
MPRCLNFPLAWLASWLFTLTAVPTTTLGYDAEGLRVSKQVGGGTPTRCLVDTLNPTGYAQVLAEYSGDGTGRQLVRAYTYGLDLLSQRTAAGGLVEFFSTDALGTTRFLTRFDPGSGGGIDGHLGELTTQTFSYDAYGLLATGSAAATAYLYAGEQWDADVGAYYLRARWYLPEWGRFLSRDPYEGAPDDPVSQNRFLYASANPINNIDPSGHMTLTEVNVTMGQIANFSRMSLRVINVYQKASSVIDAISAIQALASIVQGGQLQPYIQNGLSQFGNAIDGQKAMESLSENLQPLLTRSFPIWSRYLLQHGKNLKGFVIWLPNPGGLPQIRIPAGTYGKYSLTLVAGGMSKSGTVVGVGLRMPGIPGATDLQQIWRMDFHSVHWPRGVNNTKPSEIAAWEDKPFHYHVMYPGQ